MLLYVTNDKIASSTGGGQVTKHELEALSSLGPTDILNPEPTPDPFDSERGLLDHDLSKYRLAHFYGGTFPNLVRRLKESGVKVTYTVAAHDVEVSRGEFQKLGMEFGFPHLNDPALFERYISPYKLSDTVICPSRVAQGTNNRYGITNTTVLPHGHEPVRNRRTPKTFTVGYLGQCGPDKGVRYLIEAWSILNYEDAILTLAGSQTPMLLPLVRHFGRGNVSIEGWVESTENFFNSCSIYVQPSATEGFGIEVLEAMSAGRPVIVSEGAGASDVVEGCGLVVGRCDAGALAERIAQLREDEAMRRDFAQKAELRSKEFTWDKVKESYVGIWRGMLS